MKNLKSQIKIQKLFDLIAEIVEKAKIELQKNDWQAVGSLMNQNQQILKELGVSTEKLDQMCETALRAGAYGAKLSGAGGGDCMIALVSGKNREKVSQAIENADGKIIDVLANAEGVRDEV